MACILSKTHILSQAIYYKNIIFGPIAKVTRVRNSGYFSPIKSDTLIEKRFKLKDNISDDYKLIYREHNSLCRLINFSYYGGWFSLLIGISTSAYVIITDPPLNTEKIEGPFHTMNAPKFDNKIAMFFSIFIPASLIVTSRTIPFRIYHSSSQKLYKAVFVRNILFKKQMEIFAEGSAKPMFNRFKSIEDVLFKINKRIVLLDKECFAVQAVREKMIDRAKR